MMVRSIKYKIQISQKILSILELFSKQKKFLVSNDLTQIQNQVMLSCIIFNSKRVLLQKIIEIRIW